MVQRLMPLFFFNTHRDLVFVDQRGTGGANGLTCPAFYSVLPDLSHKAALRASVAQCLAHLKADLAFYTTAMAADDLSEVLSDLAYTKVNLLGISYGTTAEQVFLMRHPSLVRTMTLLSGTLLSVPVLERFPKSGQDALAIVISECARDFSCHRAFPSLSSDWSTLWSAPQKAPIVVPASTSPSHPAFTFSADLIVYYIHVLMTEPNTEAAVPLIIHTLAAARDRGAAVVAIAGALAKVGVVIGPGSTQNMIKYPIECGESWARDQASGLQDKNSFEYHVDLVTAQWWQYVCTLIPRSGPAAQYGTEALPSTGTGSERARRPPGPAGEHGRCSPALAKQPRTGGARPGTRHQLGDLAVLHRPANRGFHSQRHGVKPRDELRGDRSRPGVRIDARDDRGRGLSASVPSSTSEVAQLLGDRFCPRHMRATLPRRVLVCPACFPRPTPVPELWGP